jgi:hypothetical protein
MVLPVKIASCFGVLEHWSVGKDKGLNFNLNWFFSLLHYSTTPLLQHTVASGERPLKPPQGIAQRWVLWARILYLLVLTRPR